VRVNKLRVHEFGSQVVQGFQLYTAQTWNICIRREEKPETYLEGRSIITGFRSSLQSDIQAKLLMYNLIRVSKCSKCLGLRCGYWRDQSPFGGIVSLTDVTERYLDAFTTTCVRCPTFWKRSWFRSRAGRDQSHPPGT